MQVAESTQVSFPSGSHQTNATKQTSVFRVDGVRGIAEFFIGNMLQVPDLVTESFRSEVFHTGGSKGGGCSRVKVYSTISGTRLFELPFNVWMHSSAESVGPGSNRSVRRKEGGGDGVDHVDVDAPATRMCTSATTPDSGSSSSCSNIVSPNSNNNPGAASSQTQRLRHLITRHRSLTPSERAYLQAAEAALKPLPVPKPTRFESVCTMYLDENFCITDIDISRLSLT